MTPPLPFLYIAPELIRGDKRLFFTPFYKVNFVGR